MAVGGADGHVVLGEVPDAACRSLNTRQENPMTQHNVKIRFKGVISCVTVNANSAGQAKQLVKAQYGDEVDVLSVERA